MSYVLFVQNLAGQKVKEAYSISLSSNLWQIREMISSLFKKFPADAKPLQQQKNFYEAKRNESGTIPNSFTIKLIFYFI